MLQAQQSALARVPLARILVPMLIGIVAARLCESVCIPAVIILAGIIGYAIMGWMLPHTPQWSMRIRAWWIVPITAVSCGLGWMNTSLNAPPKLDTKALNGCIAQARVNDIDFSDHSMTIDATLLWVSSHDKKQLLDHKHNVSISTNGCNYNLEPGNIIQFICQIDTIRNLGNPDGFDLAQHKRDQGMLYSQHLPVASIVVTSTSHTIITSCNKLKRQLISRLFSTHISPECQNFIAATLLGNSKFITPDTRNTFAMAGISHILALSGMHVGVIMAIVWFILFPLNYTRLRPLRFILTVIILVGFALFTGMSPSVVRATIMMTVVIAGLVFHRKTLSLNSLALAAIIILLIYPSSLYSPGFQLSFVTVTFLIIFSNNNYINKRKKTSPITAWALTLTLTSIIATAATTMLTAWYFNSVSLLSVVGNILVIPIFPVIMIGATILLLLCACGIEWEWYSSLIDCMYSIIEKTAHLTGEYLPGYFGNVYVTSTDVVLYYIALVLVAIWIFTHRFKWINMALLVIAMLVASQAYTTATTPKQGLVIFNSRTHTQIFYFSNGHGTLWIPDSESDIETFSSYNKRFLSHHKIHDIEMLSGKEGYSLGGMTVACVGNGKWQKVEKLEHRIDVDLLVITKKYHNTIAKLLEIYNPREIILSGDIYVDNIEQLERECIDSKVPYYSIRTSGAYFTRPAHSK